MNTSFSEKQLFWSFIVILFLVVFFGAVFYFVSIAKGGVDGIFEGLEDRLYESRLLYSSNCFAYRDQSSGRTYTGVIDLSNYNEATLNRCTSLKRSDDQAILVELVYTDIFGKLNTEVLKTGNWDSKPSQKAIVTHSYPVNIHGNSGGTIKFIHRY